MGEKLQQSQQSPFQHDEHEHSANGGNFVWWVFAAAALAFLFVEHREHLSGMLPYLLLLACPLMHIFMHGGKHGHGHAGNEEKDKS